MSTHSNPLTNVANKDKISLKIKQQMDSPKRHKVTYPITIEDEDRSFLEMSLSKLKKYLNGK